MDRFGCESQSVGVDLIGCLHFQTLPTANRQRSARKAAAHRAGLASGLRSFLAGKGRSGSELPAESGFASSAGDSKARPGSR